MRINVAKIQPRITRRDDRTYGIQNYDKDNAYPQRVRDIVNGSGIAKSCIDIFFKFINGKGFEDVAFGKRIVDGKKLTNDKLLRKNAYDYAYDGGFAIHFNYNLLGQRTTFSSVPFSHCRLAVDEKTSEVVKIAVYDDWARERKKAIDKKDIDYIHLYNPDPATVIEEINLAGGIENYKGQIYYHGAEGELVYPLTYYDSEIEDIDTDGAIKLFKNGNIQRRFMMSHMFVRYGQSEASNNNSAGTAPLLAGERVTSPNDQQEEMVVAIKEFQGPENTNRIMLVDVDTPEQKPELIPFEQQNTDKLFEYHEKSIQSNIRQRFAIPTIFLEAVPGSLGLSKELEDAVTFYNKMTADERAVIEETYSMLFSEMFPTQSFKIKELSMFDITEVDIDAEAKGKIADAQAELRGSVGGVTALITLQQSVAAGTTSVPAGIAVIKAIYGFDEATAAAMLQGVTQGSVPANTKPVF